MMKIKFYSNYNKQNNRYFISGKNPTTGKFYNIWKNPDFNQDCYLDNSKFKNGVEINGALLKFLTPDVEGSNVLVFKTAEEERKFCIPKKFTNAKTENIYNFLADILNDLFLKNEILSKSELIDEFINNFKSEEPEEPEEPEEELPF